MKSKSERASRCKKIEAIVDKIQLKYVPLHSFIRIVSDKT